MSNALFFGIAVFVFILLSIGLGLTIKEFQQGEPRRQQKRAERRGEVPKS